LVESAGVLVDRPEGRLVSPCSTKVGTSPTGSSLSRDSAGGLVFTIFDAKAAAMVRAAP
jgi:hypothetical protein